MATTYLTKTPLSGSTSTGTLSVWIKRSGPFGSATNRMFSGFNDASNFTSIHFRDDDRLEVTHQDSGGYTYRYITDKVFRDCFAWYHLVVQFDLTNGVAGDRVKIYVNGVRQTDFDTETDPSDAAKTMDYNDSSATTLIGQQESGGYFSGSMSYFFWIDGTAYTASTFGETDSDSGEWKIITSPSVTYGTNGFLIMKNGNTITDQSGGSNDWTLGAGTLTKTEDCPDNVFSTFNYLLKSGETLSNGNTTNDLPSSDKFGGCATIGVDRYKGKFYAEFMYKSATADEGALGIFGDVTLACQDNQGVGKESYSHSYASDGTKYYENSSTSYGDTYDDGDIISIGLDTTNSFLYFAKNGAWQNGGDPESGATGTGAITISPDDAPDGHWTISAGSVNAAASALWKSNWGNGYFGDSTISSEGTNASAIGKFEHDVPAGYTALSTKGLQE